MTATLVIVESPTKAKEIGHMLGSDYVVIASVGHVRDLPVKEMGVNMTTFAASYVLTDRGSQTIAQIKKLVPASGSVYLATDPDREGEAISWHLAQALKLPDSRIRRITYHEITEKAVRAAIASPRAIDMDLVYAQEARRVLDRLIGYRVSPKVCGISGQKLSAGRVQTPTLRLIVDRELQIRAHTTIKHFGAELEFNDFTAEWDKKPYLKTDEEYILDRKIAEKAAAVTDVTVKSCFVTTQARRAAAPFTTASLMQAASNKLSMKSDETMAAAQHLFENKLITYHRTDSVTLSDEAITMIRDYAAVRNLPLPAKPNTFKAKQANAQEAHECIRPTDMFADNPSKVSGRERALYDLIHKQALASQLADAQVEQTKLTLESRDGKFSYLAQGQKVLKPGFTLIMGSIEEKRVPALKSGIRLEVVDGRVLEIATKASARYTDGSLNAELEKKGIGRPATWAAILKNLRMRGYVIDQGKSIAPTDLGIALADSLRDCAFADYGYTASLEESLDEISRGESTYTNVVRVANSEIDVDLNYVASPAGGWPAAGASRGGASGISKAKTSGRATTARKPATRSAASKTTRPSRY